MPHSDKPAPARVHSPIPILPEYFADEAARKDFTHNIFNATAEDYDRMERLLGLGSGAWYRRQALLRAGLKAGAKVVDVAVGTGLVARGAVRIVGDPALVTGVDPSTGMMAHAKLPAGVGLVEGRAEEIPFGDAEFDFLSMGYALRHISDLSVAFGEFHRVLRPGGRLCVLELTRPEGRWSTALLKAYMRVLVPIVGGVFNRSPDTARLWRYYWDTIEACAAPARVVATLEACGFREVRREVVLGIFSEYQAVK